MDRKQWESLRSDVATSAHVHLFLVSKWQAFYLRCMRDKGRHRKPESRRPVRVAVLDEEQRRAPAKGKHDPE